MTEKTADFIVKMQRERAELTDRIAKLDAVLSGLSALYPDLVAPDRPAQTMVTPPTGKEASVLTSDPDVVKADRRVPAKYLARDILNKRQGDWQTVDDITSEARRLGWGAEYDRPEAVMRTALRRMATSGRYGVERRRLDGRSWEYSVGTDVPIDDTPQNAENAVSAALSVVPTHDSPEGGEANGTGDHRDHDPREGHRDHFGGAPSVVEG
jgi:hypothetical protein